MSLQSVEKGCLYLVVIHERRALTQRAEPSKSESTVERQGAQARTLNRDSDQDDSSDGFEPYKLVERAPIQVFRSSCIAGLESVEEGVPGRDVEEFVGIERNETMRRKVVVS